MNRIILLVSMLAAGCGGSSGNGNGGGGGSGGGGGAGGGGTSVPTGVAVLNSDYKSTALSLVDPTTAKLAKDDCIDSGAVSSTLSQALSGDVVLATGKQANGELLLIDRTNSALDYLTTAAGCTVLRQMSLGTYFVNPHDVVNISATKSYVTSNEANPAGAAAGPNYQGDDIVIIDPTGETVTGHVDLSTYADDATVLPRPDRAILANGKVYVSLNENSEDFKTTGDGRIVVIDPATDAVTAKIDLTGYKACAGLDYWAASKTLAISCSGDYNAAIADQVAQSAIVLIDVSGATPSIKKAIPASALGSRPISQNFVFAGDNLIVASTNGDFTAATPPDQIWAVTLDAATAVKVVDGDAAGDFAGIVYLPATKQVLASDASATTPVVRVLDVSNPAAVAQTTTFDANPKTGLQPRQLGWY